MTATPVAVTRRQDWWSVTRAHALALVRAGGLRPVLLAAALGVVVTSLAVGAVLPQGPHPAPTVNALAVALALAAATGVHAGRWCESGAFDGALALVPDRRRLLVGQVVGTAVVAGATAVGCALVVAVATGVPAPLLSAVMTGLATGLATGVLSAQAVALGVLCRRPVPTAVALTGLWVAVPVLLAGVRVWLEGDARSAVDALVGAGPLQLVLATATGDGVGERFSGLAGGLTWAVGLTALTWTVLRERDH